MTARPPFCDGHQDVIAPGVDYATVVTPGASDRHLCRGCSALIWRYLPDLVRRQAVISARPAPRLGVRELARQLDLPHRRKQ